MEFSYKWNKSKQHNNVYSYLCDDFVRCKNRNWPTISYGRCTLNSTTSFFRDSRINSWFIVEMKAREIQLAQISRVVHVFQNQVNVLSETDTWNRRKRIWTLVLFKLYAEFEYRFYFIFYFIISLFFYFVH